MRRSTWWTVLLAATLVVAPLAGLFAAPAFHAEAVAAPTANGQHDQIVLLTLTGQIRVDDPLPPTGYVPSTWNSGSDVGWTMVATGDFNGDGRAEIVAARGDTVKVFSPFSPPGAQAVLFERSMGVGRTINLLVTGDFNGDGRADIAFTHTDTGTNVLETLKVYAGNASGTEWQIIKNESFNGFWKDMSVGDFNNDGAADLVLVRPAGNLVKVYDGRTWATMAESGFSFPWLAVVGGDFSTSYAGDEIALSRTGMQAYRDSVIILRVVGNSLVDLFADPGPGYIFNPHFPSIAAGDFTGDGDDELTLLRDPIDPKASLIVLDPAGVTMRTFEQTIGYGLNAWKSVRTGDLNGDGRAEIVVLRGDVYRVYTAPASNDAYQDFSGSYYTTYTTSNLPTMVLANVAGAGSVQGPALGVTPTSLSFDLEYGQASTPKMVSVTNTGTADVLAWQAQVLEGSAWLQLDKTSGATPGSLGVSIKTTAVSPASYTGKIRITATGAASVSNTPQDISVSLTLRGLAMVVDPTDLTFNVGYGQTSPVKPVAITSVGGVSPIQWQATVLSGADWLSLSAAQGTSPSPLNVSIKTLQVVPGSVVGTIKIEALTAQVAQPIQYITVHLTVSDSGLVVSPEQLVIRRPIGGASQVKTLSVVRPGWPVQWVATALPVQGAAAALAKIASGEAQVSEAGLVLDGVAVAPPSWLSFTPDQGVTPETMSVSLVTDTPGVYHAMIIIVAVDPSTPNRIHTVAVTGNVIAVSYVPMILK